MKPSALSRRLTDDQLTQLVHDSQSFVDQYRSEMESNFWPERREFERQANDDFTSRLAGNPEHSTIFDLSNESLNLVRNVTRFMCARTGEDIFGTKPFVGITPIGTADRPLADQIGHHGSWKLDQADWCKIGKEGIGLALNLGECIVKTTHRTDLDPHESIEIVLCDKSGQPVVCPLFDQAGQPRLTPDGQQEGDYIYQDDETVQIQDEQTGQVRAVFAKCPDIPADDDSLEFREVLVEENTVKYHGLDVANVRFDALIASLTVSRLDLSPIVCHEYTRTVSQLRALYGNPGDQDLEDLFQQLEQEPDTPKTAEDKPRVTYGETTAGGSRIDRNPPVKVQEIYLHEYNCFGDGRGRNIFLVLVADHDTPLYVEYLANITVKGRLPFHAVPVNRVPQRWYGRGFYQLYKHAQRLIDALINAILFRNQINADPIVCWQPAATEEGASEKKLVRRPGKTITLRPGKTARDAIEIVEFPDLDDRTWELVQLIMQLVQTDSGVTSAAQGDYSSLPSTNTATGISSILQSASTLHRMLTEDLKDGFEPAVEFGLLTIYANQDKDETYLYLGGKASDVLKLDTARAIAKLDLHVRILLTRFQMREQRENAQSVITQVLPSWIQTLQAAGLPTDGVAAAAQPLYVQVAKGSDIQDAEAIFTLPTRPPPASGPSGKVMESMNYKDVPPDIKRQMELAAGFKPSTQDDSEEEESGENPKTKHQESSTKNASSDAPPLPVNVIPDPASDTTGPAKDAA